MGKEGGSFTAVLTFTSKLSNVLLTCFQILDSGHLDLHLSPLHLPSLVLLPQFPLPCLPVPFPLSPLYPFLPTPLLSLSLVLFPSSFPSFPACHNYLSPPPTLSSLLFPGPILPFSLSSCLSHSLLFLPSIVSITTLLHVPQPLPCLYPSLSLTTSFPPSISPPSSSLTLPSVFLPQARENMYLGKIVPSVKLWCREIQVCRQAPPGWQESALPRPRMCSHCQGVLRIIKVIRITGVLVCMCTCGVFSLPSVGGFTEYSFFLLIFSLNFPLISITEACLSVARLL